MTPEQETLYAVKGLVGELDSEAKARTLECAEKIRKLVAEYSDCGRVALALVGAEMAAAE